MKNYLFYLLLLVSFIPNPLLGQSIKGTVLSASDSLPISGADVRILRLDSTLIKGVVSDRSGLFEMDLTKQDQFDVIISFVGFSTERIAIRGFKDNLHLGTIFLQEATHQLDEVEVRATPIIHRVDKSIIIPTALHQKVSRSSFGLLRNLNLPGLSVDEIEQTISINGQPPLIMIDGVLKTRRDLLAINPKNIARIEYENTPSIRNMDRNEGGTIHVILKQKEQGGNTSGSVLGSPMTGFLNTDLFFSYNRSRSEFSVNYFNNWRDYSHRWTDKEEQFISSTDRIGRTFKGVDSPFDYLNQGVYVNYAYLPGKNTMLNVVFRNDFGKQHTSVNGHVKESHKGDPFYRDSKSESDYYIPALDLFFRHNMKNRQSLQVNVVGTLHNNDYERLLIDKADVDLNKVFNRIDNRSKSLISEIVYKKQFKGTHFSLGYQNKIGSSTNTYKDKANVEENLTENNNYIYGSVTGSLNKVSYSAGSGIKIFAVKDDFDERTYVKNLSTLNLMYAANDNFNIKWSSFFRPHLPGLSQLSNVTQIYDELLKMKGNPDLKASYTLGTNLFANYTIKSFNTNLTVGFSRMEKPIYVDVQPIEGKLFISQPKNGKWNNHFNLEWKCSYMGLLDHINLFTTVGFNSFATRGDDYKHHLDNVYWDISAQFYWGNWTLSAFYVKPKKTLHAQLIDVAENNSQISLDYTYKNLNFIVAVKYPFEKKGWKWREENLSKVNPYTTRVYIEDNKNMFLLGVTYNFDFGKGFKKLGKNLNNMDNASSILKVQE